MPLMGHHCKDMASLVYRVLSQMCEGVREGQLDKSMLQGAASQVVFMVIIIMLLCQCRRHKRCGFNPWVRKIPWRRAWQPVPVFLPGESPWTEKPGGLQSMVLQRVRHNWSDLATATAVESRKGYRWTYLQGRNRDTDTGNGLVDTVGEEGWMNWDSTIETYITMCKIAS